MTNTDLVLYSSMTAQEVENRRKATAAEKVGREIAKKLESDRERKHKADAVMSNFDDFLKQAIIEQKFSFALVRLKYGDYSNTYPYNELTLSTLSKTQPWVGDVWGKIVEKDGFHPSFVFVHDGVGRESWFDLIVSF